MAAETILIVDDIEDNRRILAARLRRFGEFRLLEACNGLEALKVVESSPPDLIFLDLKMPVMNGWETARRIRAREDVLRVVPIIAITAQALPGDEVDALLSGCDAYLSKPILDWRAVADLLRKLLEEWQAKRRQSPSPGAPSAWPEASSPRPPTP